MYLGVVVLRVGTATYLFLEALLRAAGMVLAAGKSWLADQRTPTNHPPNGNGNGSRRPNGNGNGSRRPNGNGH